MGFSSQAGHIILRTQSELGTYPSDVSTAGVGVKLRSGGLGPSRELLIPDPEIGGGRDVADAYLGPSSWSGDLEFYARMNSLATMVAAALGATAAPAAGTAPDTGLYTHVITPSDASQLPYLAIEERVGAGFEVFNYTDCVVNTFHLEAEASGYLQGTVGVIAALQEAGKVPTPNASIPWDNTPMIVGTNIAVRYNGVSLPAKSFSIDINNNFEDDDFRLGSFFIGDLTPKRREVTASFSIREASSALWRQAVYGQSSATQVGGLVTKAPLEIEMKTYETVNPSGGVKPFSLKIEIPEYSIMPYALGISGDDILESDIEGQALRPDAAVGIATFTIENSLATIA